MRPLTLVLAAVLMLSAPAAMAAPTCMTKDGDGIRCGSPGAMPVGWSITPQQRLRREQLNPTPPLANGLLGLVILIAGMFILVGLMPDFDGWREGDWDQQESDKDGVRGARRKRPKP